MHIELTRRQLNFPGNAKHLADCDRADLEAWLKSEKILAADTSLDYYNTHALLLAMSTHCPAGWALRPEDTSTGHKIIDGNTGLVVTYGVECDRLEDWTLWVLLARAVLLGVCIEAAANPTQSAAEVQ